MYSEAVQDSCSNRSVDEESKLEGCYDVMCSKYRHSGGNVLPVPSASSSFGCVTSVKIRIFSLWKTGIV